MELSNEVQNALLYGSLQEITIQWKNSTIQQIWRGILQIALDALKDDAADYMVEKICSACNGNRLNPQSLSVKIANKGIAV